MSHVLLVCSGGMSSAIVLKDLEKEFQKLGEPLRAKAVGSGQAQDEISAGEWDLVLVAPQVRNRLKTFQQYADRHGIPICAIPPIAYGPLGGSELVKTVKEHLG